MEICRRSHEKLSNTFESENNKEDLSLKIERRNRFCWLKHGQLYVYEEVPKHLQSNSFILNGYRHNLSWSQCLKSFFLFHNETLNTWTHFLGFLLFSWYLVRDFLFSPFNESVASVDDYLMLLFYVLSIMSCMIASTLLHLLSGCSMQIYEMCLKLDLFGIALATLASFCMGLHLLFKCHFYIRLCYEIGIILLLFSVIFFHGWKSNDTINSTAFILVAASGFIPLFHWLLLVGYNSNAFYFLENTMIFYFFFGAGIFFFITKIPERFRPGYFDYIGASHQLWHIFSLIAFCWWYNNSLKWIEYHQRHQCHFIPTNTTTII